MRRSKYSTNECLQLSKSCLGWMMGSCPGRVPPIPRAWFRPWVPPPTCSTPSTFKRFNKRSLWKSLPSTALATTASTSPSSAFGNPEGSELRSLSDSSHSVGSCGGILLCYRSAVDESGKHTRVTARSSRGPRLRTRVPRCDEDWEAKSSFHNFCIFVEARLQEEVRKVN